MVQLLLGTLNMTLETAENLNSGFNLQINSSFSLETGSRRRRRTSSNGFIHASLNKS